MTNPLTTEAKKLSPGRIRMLDHLLTTGMTLSATDVADLRKALAVSETAKKAVHDIIVWLDAEIESGERCKVNKQWPRRYRREQEIRAKSALDMRFMITALHGGES